MSTVSATIKILDGFSGPLSKLNSGLQAGQSRFSQFKSAMNGNPFGSVNKSAQQTGGIFKQMLGANLIGSGISKGVGMATSGIGSMMTELNDSSKAWQTFNGNMSMIGQSQGQINKTRGSLQKYAQQTIYSASDMASTYSQLAAVGTKNTGQLVKGFGGLAAASADPQQAMKTLSQQATQAAAKPQIQWADFKLMLEQTPAGMAMVAKTMHKSTGQLVKDVQAGKVKTDDFFNAIAKTGTNKNFSKMATQYKTVGQAMDGLKETLANNLQPAFDKVGKVGIKAISELTDSLGKVKFDTIADKITPMVTGVVNGLKTAGKAVRAFFKSFSDSGAISSMGAAFSSIKETIGSVIGKLSSMGTKDPFAAFKTLGSITGGALKGAANAITAISDVIGDLDPSSLKVLGAAFVALKAGTKGLILTAVVAGLTALSKLDSGTLNALAKALGVLAIGLVTIKTLGKLDSAFTGLSRGIKSLGSGGAISKIGSSASAGAAGFIKLGASLLLVGGAILLAGAGMWLMVDATTSLVAAGWPAVAVFAGMVIGIAALAAVVALIGPAMIAGAVGFVIFGAALLIIGVAVFVAAAGLAILATQLPLIAQYGLTAAINILALAGAIAVFGLGAIVAAVGLILLGAALLVVGVGFAVAAIGALLFGVAMAIVAATVLIAAVGMLMLAVAVPLVAAFSLVAAVGLLMMSAALMIIAVVGLIAGAGMIVLGVGLMLVAPLAIVAAAGILLLGAAAIVLGAGLIIVAAGLAAVAAGLILAAAGVMVLVTAFITAGTMLVSAIVGAMKNVISAVSDGISTAVSTAKSFGSALVSVGKDLIQGLVNGIKSMISTAVSTVKNVAGSVVKAAKSVLHIGSPSKLFNQYGRWVDQGLINGLNRDAGGAASASSAMAQGVVNAASGMSATLPNLVAGSLAGNNAGDVLADGFGRALVMINRVSKAIDGLGSNSIGVNGRMASDLPLSSPYGEGKSTTTTNTNYGNDESNVVVQVQSGAIQLVSSGNAQMDGEAIVRAAEDYLKHLNGKSMS
ncbi:tape measure protein [Lactiplantibacillus plajomi]|uniref:Tape measure protein n=1 Tax=Lactiplantibacillus plajomi TaxID=1457217 RepID=A0ABV6K0U5_9LACO|nr:tape measure protein [Lactiplantibacillus plajomi]